MTIEQTAVRESGSPGVRNDLGTQKAPEAGADRRTAGPPETRTGAQILCEAFIRQQRRP